MQQIAYFSAVGISVGGRSGGTFYWVLLRMPNWRRAGGLVITVDVRRRVFSLKFDGSISPFRRCRSDSGGDAAGTRFPPLTGWSRVAGIVWALSVYLRYRRARLRTTTRRRQRGQISAG
ncbi:hypothetical protein KCP74_24145 [Salmonella enterica subsp. enterica]|nr:hypothetical protein KCP74_24145 [Salmonella enterica subsp. enterica]